jgi:ABC-2 type transport system ATP-binding protein
MLTTRVVPTSGRAYIGAIDVISEPALTKQLIGIVSQTNTLDRQLTVWENLYFHGRLFGISAAESRRIADELLEQFQLSHWASASVYALSGGMAQRLMVARSIFHRPAVLFLDEPTAGLDPRVAYEVRQLIKTRKGRCTLIVSSHNLQELEEICDGAAILDRGKVVASGSISELTAASEEVHVRLGAGPVPIAVVRELPMVKRVEWDDEKRELVVYFDRGSVDAETVIGQVLWALLQNQARISGVSKGRGLEQRVMELT